MIRRSRLRVLAAALAVAPVTGAVVQPAHAGGDPIVLTALSNRADLVSGGDVLVELAGGPDVRVRAGGRDVTPAFRRTPDGRRVGLVTGLPVGRTDLTAQGRAGRATLTIRNHDLGGPVFSGPQVQPWICQTDEAGLGPAQDADCNAPTKVEYLYVSTTGLGFQAYDPAAPPSDVATTTTDQGKTVPFVVRKEIGTMNRGVFHTAVLWDPKAPSTPWSKGPWNGKLYYKLEGGAGPTHEQGSEPSDVMQQTWLGKGFAVASNTLNTFGQNANTVTSAEAIMMLKEHLVEQLGPIRYTMSSGGSGASIQQNTIANAYPGMLDGITTAVMFMDGLTTAQEVLDCVLLNRYYTHGSPQLWPVVTQRAAVNGHASLSTCLAWDHVFQFDDTLFDPRVGCKEGLPVTQGQPDAYVYEPETNPGGARCTVQDYLVAIFGTRPRSAWGPVERRLGKGFANLFYDNHGVQYGLRALQDGTITPEQFVDLNEKIGGVDIDKHFQAQRSTGDPFAWSAAYRSGQVNDATNLDRIPIIDTRPHLNAEIHTEFRSWSLRERLDKANGGHGNQTIWTFDPGTREDDATALALPVLDSWLAGIESDRSGRALEQKVRAHRPAVAADACYVEKVRIDDPDQCHQLYPYYADPRIAAGAPLRDDVLACQLRPVRRTDYPASLTDAQLARLQAVFPRGVCDWTRPSRGATKTVTWLQFDRPGGTPLGAAPVSRYTAYSQAIATGALPATGLASSGPWLAALILAAGLLTRSRRSRNM